MDPIVSDGRTRLRFWKGLTSPVPVSGCVERLKEATAGTFLRREDKPIAGLVGKNWALIWKRVNGRHQPMRALFLRLEEKGMGTEITAATAIHPIFAIVFPMMIWFAADLHDGVALTAAAVLAGVIGIALLFSKSEGEMLMAFARRTLEAQERV